MDLKSLMTKAQKMDLELGQLKIDIIFLSTLAVLKITDPKEHKAIEEMFITAKKHILEKYKK